MVSRSPLILDQPEAFRAALDQARRDGKRVGLVPTMGALHEGHLALVTEARSRASFVAVTVFVNPTQFGPNEDYSRYPRTLERDVALCGSVGADCVFAPDVKTMYPDGELTRVRVDSISVPLCGVTRPGHFEGVATIVAKYFALSGACVAVFGRKDYQQLKVIERMARDLLFPVEVVGFPTVREPDGLAMSSRNRYLSEDARARAAHIPRALSASVRLFEAGERGAGALRQCALERIQRIADSIDYVEVADPDSLRLYESGEHVGERALVALAIRIGPARLIDNVVLGEDAAPCGEEAG
ncbi:MAG: pantoate--beta-alanine ligase [Deltaproteobacteria bacterium]|nr:pantoate--beta-alanine ligase [Deltaproteobacteria bacterium]